METQAGMIHSKGMCESDREKKSKMSVVCLCLLGVPSSNLYFLHQLFLQKTITKNPLKRRLPKLSVD